MKKPKLPNTDSINELANFWDTHDVTDFEHELTEVSEPVFQRRDAIQIHLAPRDLAAVKKRAKAVGATEEDLIRGWVLQHLADSRGRGSKKRTSGAK